MSRRSVPITVSLTPADLETLDRLAQATDGNRSLVVRWLLRGYGGLSPLPAQLGEPPMAMEPASSPDRYSGSVSPSRSRLHRREGRPVTLEEVRAHRRQILRILRRHGMTNPRVFGSVARSEAKLGSDLDLVVDYQPPDDAPMAYYCHWGDAKEELEALLGVPVHLFPANELKPSIAAEIEVEGQPV